MDNISEMIDFAKLLRAKDKYNDALKALELKVKEYKLNKKLNNMETKK